MIVVAVFMIIIVVIIIVVIIVMVIIVALLMIIVMVIRVTMVMIMRLKVFALAQRQLEGPRYIHHCHGQGPCPKRFHGPLKPGRQCRPDPNDHIRTIQSARFGRPHRIPMRRCTGWYQQIRRAQGSHHRRDNRMQRRNIHCNTRHIRLRGPRNSGRNNACPHPTHSTLLLYHNIIARLLYVMI